MANVRKAHFRRISRYYRIKRGLRVKGVKKKKQTIASTAKKKRQRKRRGEVYKDKMAEGVAISVLDSVRCMKELRDRKEEVGSRLHSGFDRGVKK